jgi:hypothetical protein
MQNVFSKQIDNVSNNPNIPITLLESRFLNTEKILYPDMLKTMNSK